MTDQITVPRATWDALREALEHILSGALSLPRFAEDEGRAAIALAGAVQMQPAQRTGDCLLTGVCASEGHHIQHRLQGHLMDEQERSSFEAWIAKDCGDLRKFGFGLNTHYSNDAVNNAWTGWKQRAALTAAASASHANPENAPATEGGAITSESAANAVSAEPKVNIDFWTPVHREPQAQAIAWDEGYAAGVNDERISECNIGIAGFDAKVNPARENPYRRTHPQATEPAVKEWISVNDQMPPPMERVLASEPMRRIVKVDMWFGPDFQWSYTHWMPLPPAPKEQDK